MFNINLKECSRYELAKYLENLDISDLAKENIKERWKNERNNK